MDHPEHAEEAFPPSDRDWDGARSVLVQRTRMAAYAREFATMQLEQTRRLRRVVDGEADR